MTFKVIVWKMAKANYKKYLLYFLCNSFAVMFFFMFSTVFFNEQVVAVKEVDALEYLLAIPGVALILFTIFFVQYAHDIFIKRRTSEFGLFMTIGMSNRDIGKLLNVESTIISVSSCFAGILGGVVFSRLFFLLLMSTVGMGRVPYQLTIEMFLYPIIVFLIIYWFAVGKSHFFIVKHNHLQHLKSDQVAETIRTRNPLFGLIGLILIIVSITGLYVTSGIQSGNGELLYLWSFLTFFGLYICIPNFTGMFIEFTKKFKVFYYPRILLLTAIEYKLKRLSSIIMLVTVMVMVTILYSTIQLYSSIENERRILEMSPFDLAFLQTETKNNTPLEEILMDDVEQHVVIPIVEYYERTYNFLNVYKLMPIESFNKLTGRQIELQPNEFIYFINEEEQFAGDINQHEKFSILTNDGEVTLIQKEMIIERQMNYVGSSGDYVVVNEEQWRFLKGQVDGYEVTIHLINVKDWRESGNLVAKLENAFKQYNKLTPPISDILLEYTTEEQLFEIDSKIEGYSRNKVQNGILFFVTTFLSIIFFFASFILLYLNLFSDIDKEKVKYKKLYRIGITKKEVKRMVSAEIRTLFFLPTLLGTIVAFLYMIAMSRDIGGVLKNPDILSYFIVISIIYHSIQFGFYLFSKRRMVSQLMNNR